MAGMDEVRWARRVPKDKIRRLYTLDAKGIVDEELIDDVGYAIYARCDSIRLVTQAHAGQVTCPRCATLVERPHGDKTARLACGCGWETAWGEYQKSYQGRQLFGGNAFPAFEQFLERWPRARNSRDKLLAIDWMIHQCHLPEGFPWARPAATNLIEGTASEIATFLDELAYGDQSTPGLAENRETWRSLRGERFFPGSYPRAGRQDD